MRRLIAVALTVLVVATVHGSSRQSSEGIAPLKPTSTSLSVSVTEFTLANGLHVILHRDASVPVVSVNVWYHVGSGNEKPGRTGFAHLFEHLMFEGSKNVPEGAFDNWLEAAGGSNNGSTTNDRTNYYIDIPSNALDLALFLESDRMGYLLDTMTPARVDGQRDVVKNERRQSYENQPYGRAFLELAALLYPKTHPYSWPTIGSMEDLTAASRDDVAEFFRTYYAPNNASLVIAGDIDLAEARRLVEKWFNEVPKGPPVPAISAPPVALDSVKTKTITDRVQLPRLYLAWHTPALYAPGDSAMDVVSGVLSGGKNSRLYKRLVYDLQLAQDVTAAQISARYGSRYLIMVTARPSPDPYEKTLERIKGIVDEELDKLRATPPDAREVERVKNGYEAGFFSQMEQIAAKADQLNAYYFATGNPDYFATDLARYQRLTPQDIQNVLKTYLLPDKRLELSVVPDAKKTEGGR